MGTYFDTAFEQESIDTGISAQQRETGVQVQWWFFDRAETRISDLYDEDTPTSGRAWRGPYPIPVLQATRTEGSLEDAGEGGYVVDSINLVLGYRQAVDAGLMPAPDRTNAHLRDRFVFDGKVWAPSSIVARNLLGGRGTRATVLVSATEVRDDEMINDPQFQRYAEKRFVQPDTGYIPD
jgi:hypothetical protein